MLTIPQTTAFFTEDGQMGLSARTRTYLQDEGIVTADDLSEFATKDSWTQVIDNCRKPPKIPDPINAGQLIEQEAFRIKSKSLMRLKVAAIAASYYEATSRPLTATSMTWTHRLKNFELQWSAIVDAKDEEVELPLVNSLQIVKWVEAMEAYLLQKIGVRNAPLAYVTREVEAVDAPAPPLELNEPHSVEHGSVIQEMVHRLSHTNALFRTDNAAVFDDVELGVRGTKYTASIAPFKRAKDGRGAFLALKAQHCGAAMWESEIKTQLDFLMNRKFTGGSSTTLATFLSMHRTAFTQLQRCHEMVPCQIPDDRARVGYLIDNIDCDDHDVRAALAAIKLQDPGMRTDFEQAVAFLLPVDPVTIKKRNKRALANISATTGQPHGGPAKVPLKSGRGSSGVELRYYAPKEYQTLNKEQRDELREWRKRLPAKKRHIKKEGGGGGTKHTKSNLRGQIASVIKEIATEDTKKSDAMDDFKALIASLISETVASDGSSVAEIAASRGEPWSAKPGNKKVKFCPNHADLLTKKPSASAAAEVAAVKLQAIMASLNVSGSKKDGR